jgi:hypothetical protein
MAGNALNIAIALYSESQSTQVLVQCTAVTQGFDKEPFTEEDFFQKKSFYIWKYRTKQISFFVNMLT